MAEILALDFLRANPARILRGRSLNYVHRRITTFVTGPEGGEPNDAPEPPNWGVWQHETFRGGHVIVHVRLFTRAPLPKSNDARKNHRRIRCRVPIGARSR